MRNRMYSKDAPCKRVGNLYKKSRSVVLRLFLYRLKQSLNLCDKLIFRHGAYDLIHHLSLFEE